MYQHIGQRRREEGAQGDEDMAEADALHRRSTSGDEIESKIEVDADEPYDGIIQVAS